MGGHAWPFLVLVDSVNERDLGLLIEIAFTRKYYIFLEGHFGRNSRQIQVCDALRCSGLSNLDCSNPCCRENVV